MLNDLDTAQSMIDFLAICTQAEACESALVWLNQCVDECLTLRQAISVTADRNPGEGETWCAWVRQEVSDLGPDVRFALSDEATSTDPRLAAHLYIYRSDLSLAESEMLYARFHSSVRGEVILPNIERQLTEGIVVPVSQVM